jgi:hypothetical protein
MLVNLVVSGAVIDTKNTDNETAVKIFSGGPYTTPEITARVSGANRFYDGKLNSGSMLGHVASAGRGQLVWKSSSNATVGVWKMDSEAAVEAAIETIQTALAASDAVISIDSTGAEYTGS